MLLPKVGMYVIGDWDANRTPNKAYRIVRVLYDTEIYVRIADNEDYSNAPWDWWVRSRNVKLCPILKKEREINVSF